MNKKMVLATAALALLVASPAFAASARKSAAKQDAQSAYAQAPRAAVSPNPVYSADQEYLGADPDPFIRSQLLRDDKPWEAND